MFWFRKCKRVVIYQDEMGVYLGSAMGLGFWSKLDPVGQTDAVTFKNKTEATEFVATWDHIPEDLKYVFVRVPKKLATQASAAECEKAGLHNWLKESVACQSQRQR